MIFCDCPKLVFLRSYHAFQNWLDSLQYTTTTVLAGTEKTYLRDTGIYSTTEVNHFFQGFFVIALPTGTGELALRNTAYENSGGCALRSVPDINRHQPTPTNTLRTGLWGWGIGVLGHQGYSALLCHLRDAVQRGSSNFSRIRPLAGRLQRMTSCIQCPIPTTREKFRWLMRHLADAVMSFSEHLALHRLCASGLQRNARLNLTECWKPSISHRGVHKLTKPPFNS